MMRHTFASWAALALASALLTACGPAGSDDGSSEDPSDAGESNPTADAGSDEGAADAGPDEGAADAGAGDGNDDDAGPDDPIDDADAGPDDAPDAAVDEPDPGPLPTFAELSGPGDQDFDDSAVESVVADGAMGQARAYVPSDEIRSIALFLPGFQLETAYYAPLFEHLASHGHAVVVVDPPMSLLFPNHPRMAEVGLAGLDWALDAGGPLAGLDDESLWVIGHSLGGKLSFMVADRDVRLDGVFAIDPVNGGNPLTGYTDSTPDVVPSAVENLAIPLGIVGEVVDADTQGMACAPRDVNFSTFFDAATAAPFAYEWDFLGVSHMDFVDDTSTCGFTCSACEDGTADPVEARAKLRALALSFAERHFVDDERFDAVLVGDQLPDGIELRSRP